MEKQQLHSTLAQLHEELAKGPELDAESRSRLSQLLADIQQVLQNEPAAEESPDEDASLTDRLQDAIIDFEATYPRFSQLMGRIADGLSQLGI
ncbi:MAG: DUF4404 family protein [Planctomycetaceae bacterium]|nr:DUF4404 family protein [Planctomycetaceae bacterium]